MSFLQTIQRCNRCNYSNFIPFLIDGVQLGQVRPSFAEHFHSWPELFSVSPNGLTLIAPENDFTSRSVALAEVLKQLVEKKVISHLHGEQYVATPSGIGEGVVMIDRAAAPYFGIRAFGQHVNCYMKEDGVTKMWLARRSSDRRNFPDKLDNVAAGGLPCNIDLQENLRKECSEEASIPSHLADQAIATGTITYNCETDKGFKADTLYCYDLELPANFQPSCNDGEVEAFYLWPIEKVMEISADGSDFKPNSNLVVIDFLIRHGFIQHDHEDYLELVTGLHPEVAPMTYRHQ